MSKFSSAPRCTIDVLALKDSRFLLPAERRRTGTRRGWSMWSCAGTKLLATRLNPG